MPSYAKTLAMAAGGTLARRAANDIYNLARGKRSGKSGRTKYMQPIIIGRGATLENNRLTDTHSVIVGFSRSAYNLTTDITGSTVLADTVLGDRFKNVLCKWRFAMPPGTTQCRVVIFYTKRVGSGYTPANTRFGIADIPDPAYVTVLHDMSYTPPNASTGWSVAGTTNLRNYTTIYNRSATQLEKGELVVAVLTEGTATGTAEWVSRHYYRNI